MKAIACILVLWPAWIIWKLYEQNPMAMAPPMARSQSTPRDSISRKPPSRAMNRYVAGRFPSRKKSYTDCVASPPLTMVIGVVGMPENMDPVHCVGSSGCASFHVVISRDIPT